MKIRNNVFETNSSSCHSLSISSNVIKYESITPNGDSGELLVDPYEFGWGYESIRDAGTKLAYLLQYIFEWTGDNAGLDWEQANDRVKNQAKTGRFDFQYLATEKSRSFYKTLEQMVCEQTGCTSIGIKCDNSDSWYPIGYIDHQSVEDNDLDDMFDDVQALKDFVFNPTSVLILDNDNH